MPRTRRRGTARRHSTAKWERYYANELAEHRLPLRVPKRSAAALIGAMRALYFRRGTDA